MKKNKKEQKKKRPIYVITLLLILMVALWITPKPTRPMQEFTPQLGQQRNDLKLIEKKRVFVTGKNVPVFQRLFVVPYIDEPHVAVMFNNITDQTGLLDSMTSHGWQKHSRYALGRSFQGLTNEYQKDEFPILYGEWDTKQELPDSAHFIVEVQIEGVAINHAHKRTAMWQHLAQDQYGIADTALITRNSLVRVVEISGVLRVTTQDGTQMLRRPIKRSYTREEATFEGQGSNKLLRLAPRVFSNDLEGHAANMHREDQYVIKRALFEFCVEAVNRTNTWVVHPVYKAKHRRGSVFDLREGAIERKEYVPDTTRITDRYPQVPIYNPFKH